MTRLELVCTLVVAALAGLATSAAADLPEPGPNGQIAFTSGRDDPGPPVVPLDNTTAQVWLLNSPGGSPTRLTNINTAHYRHPAWSPDHTKIAYAATTSAQAFTGPWDILVQDLTQPLSLTNPMNITGTAEGEERPAWSPDGTRIAYQVFTGGNINIETRPATGGSPTTVATTIETGAANGGSFFNRPHWSPDSSTIFYGELVGTNDHDIRKSLANGSQPNGVDVVDGTTNDYQPQVSPDGTKICFTRQGATKDVLVAPSTGGTGLTVGTALVTDNAANDDYECAWSPDQSRIAFTRGAQDAGQVRMGATAAGGTSTLVSDVASTFDGNPDWAINFRPVCQNGSASVAFNSFVSIPLVCSDREGPSFDPDIVTPPAHGNLGAIDNDKVIYTPTGNFQGQDSFTFKNSDGNSDSNPATIQITVGGPGGNQAPATIEALTMSPRRWRRGSALPTFSAAPVGTTIGVRLSAAGRVTLTFRRARPGRRVNRRCVKPTPRNRTRRRCTRYVRAGALSFDGKQGANSVRFQGRLSARKRLALGRYRLSAVVTEGGQTSPSRTVAFRIVRR